MVIPQPVLDVPVATSLERGLLGIEVSSNNNNLDGKTCGFLYYTKSGNGVDESVIVTVLLILWKIIRARPLIWQRNK